MFSGQGSHYYQMGRDLFEHHPVFRKWMLRVNEMVRGITGVEILGELYGSGRCMSEVFDNLIYSNLSIVMVEYALYNTLSSLGIYPDYVMGASLGEYLAATVAGALDVEVLFASVYRLSESICKQCPRGGMIAVMHDWKLYFNSRVLKEKSELAARNYSSHFVVSGEKESLRQVEDFLKCKHILHQKLHVKYAFHSSLIDSAKSVFLPFLRSHKYSFTGIPYISCIEPQPVELIGDQHFWNVIRSPIEFQTTIQNLESRQACTYLDLGPSGSLANFVRYNLDCRSESEAIPIVTPFGQAVPALEEVATKYCSRLLPKSSSMRITQHHFRKREKQMMTWVFPGQGSQYKGMGEDLWDLYPEYVIRADAILGYSVKELCMEDPCNRLDQTQYTQPALYVVNALSFLRSRDETGKKPDYLAGHSLGEYNALMASGCFDFETGLKLVQKRSALMSKAPAGAMAAIINLSANQITDLLCKNQIDGVDIANYNAPSQIVISGTVAALKKAVELFRDAKATCIPLRVSAAFHSRYMQPFRDAFDSFLKGFEFNEMVIPVISNVHARPYRAGQVRANLSDQLTNSVQWTNSIRYLMAQGQMDFEEIGPGRVLTNLIKRIRSEIGPLPFNNESVYPVQSAPEVPGTDINPKKAAVQFTTTVIHSLTSGAERCQAHSDTLCPAIGGRPFSGESLGCDAFKNDYELKYAYLSGAMFRGIASKELVVRMGRAGLMGSLGTGGMELEQIEKNIQWIQKELHNGQPYAMNLLSNVDDTAWEEQIVDLYLRYGIKVVEASAFMQITPDLVRFRLKGLQRGQSGSIWIAHKIIAKISRPEVAENFLKPAPASIVSKLLQTKQVTGDQAEMAALVPMADDLCVEADSGGHTDRGSLAVLLPTMIRLRDRLARQFGYAQHVRIGAAGGIGTPEAAAAAFVLGADFILTGSINQCTVESGTSDSVKDLLQTINVQDTDYAPAADMFEYGAKVQVVRKGLFFPARANKLFDLYRRYNSLDEIDAKTRRQIEERYFKCSFEEVYAGTKAFFQERNPGEIERAERNPKHKMALVFRWYLFHSMQLALQGVEAQKVDYQIHCGPALGAFNEWVKGTQLENWHNRHVDGIAEKLMQETAALLNDRLRISSNRLSRANFYSQRSDVKAF